MTHSTIPTAPMSGRAVAALQQEVAAVRGELARVDAKCALLVSLAAGGLALVATVDLPADVVGAVTVLRQFAGVLFAAAVGVVLVAVLPRIPRRGGTGFVAHARHACPADLLASLTSGADGAQEEGERLSAEVWRLSRLALAKYRTIRVAVWLLIAATTTVLVALLMSR
ncbi:Pycsar system effector family protein [Streptosporangium jomthongense]|uniref:Pycsar system effector family protein n=1 Tax=Streptosporangium jomthongense TaxID=1193683 RepID=A0ABV8F7F6_9ACTN